MDRNFIISVLEDAKSFYKDDKLKAIEEAISIVQDYSKMEEKRKRMSDIISEMRNLTPEERESQNKHIKSISKPTGINIFDLYKEEERCRVCGGIKRFGICQDCGTDI